MSSYAAPSRTVGRLKRPFGNLHYEVSGSGPALIFAHGLGGNHLSWWQQLAHFALRYTCVTFAHRGFAPSDPVAGGVDPTDYAGDLAALIEHLGFSDVRLVAQSMGGWTMLEYALAHQDRVKAAIRPAVARTTPGSRRPKRRSPPAWRAASIRRWANARPNASPLFISSIAASTRWRARSTRRSCAPDCVAPRRAPWPSSGRFACRPC
jgi:pimeloyl-ACP methyl ester carboxylesterase